MACISRSSVEQIQKKLLLDAKLYVEGSSKVISGHLRRACARVMTIGGFSTSTKACKIS